MNTHPLNLTLRFLLELVMLAILAYWGDHLFPGWKGVAAAIAFPVGAATIWGVFRIPNDPRPAPVAISGVLRLALEWGLFGWATWALHDLGYDKWAWIFLGVLVAHYLFSYDRTGAMLRNRPYKGFVKG